MIDDRIVYSAHGTWWDSIDKIALTKSGLPCCPHCGSVLFEMTEWNWWAGVKKYDQEHPGYWDMLTWARGRCFANLPAMQKAYEESKA